MGGGCRADRRVPSPRSGDGCRIESAEQVLTQPGKDRQSDQGGLRWAPGPGSFAGPVGQRPSERWHGCCDGPLGAILEAASLGLIYRNQQPRIRAAGMRLARPVASGNVGWAECRCLASGRSVCAVFGQETVEQDLVAPQDRTAQQPHPAVCNRERIQYPPGGANLCSDALVASGRRREKGTLRDHHHF